MTHPTNEHYLAYELYGTEVINIARALGYIALSSEASPRVRAGETKRARTIQEVVTSARRLFQNKGYDDTTVEEIAESSGRHIRTPYGVFKNKSVKGSVGEIIFHQDMHALTRQLMERLPALNTLAGFVELAAIFKAYREQIVGIEHYYFDKVKENEDSEVENPLAMYVDPIVDFGLEKEELKTDIPRDEIVKFVANSLYYEPSALTAELIFRGVGANPNTSR